MCVCLRGCVTVHVFVACVTQFDPEYEQHEKEFKAISREILGEEESSEEEDGHVADGEWLVACMHARTHTHARGRAHAHRYLRLVRWGKQRGEGWQRGTG